jgi:predicted nucleic acid-binding protein
VIYVDSNIPMYLVSADHPLKRRVVEVVPRLLSARELLVTSAETFQELIHRYLAVVDRVHLVAAYEALEAMVTTTSDVTKRDVDQASALSGDHPALPSRHCLHVAVMRRLECTRVWSYDSAFDTVPSVQRIE